MNVQDYFKPLLTWTPEKAREFLNNKKQVEYNLVDVRQPKEYESGHIPGAQLIPLDQLPDRIGELDPDKVTIAYCAKGIRSRAAAALLSNSDFKEVHSIEGGLNAWQGRVAEGIPEAGMAFFSPASNPEQLIALAWLLEDGSRKFYNELSSMLNDKDAAVLFRELTLAEEHHKSSLLSLYKQLSGKDADTGFPWSVLDAKPVGDVMEGGTKVNEALQWVQGKSVQDILELSISLETNSYDLYLKMERTMKEENSKKLFRLLSDEEKLHLERLTNLFESKL
ncbi:MAG TPA: rhodanese-like domain-containing protein [Thermodesulfovibrionales bacterium]|nr:rhodanese-like domain-containing protein [Thermodesulfovibrionales bacterium]